MPDVVNFPQECPTCKTAEGRPHAIDGVIRSGALNIWMRCGYCNYEWRFSLPVTISTHDSGVHRKPQL
jgi:hypothetical protein